MFGVVDEGVGVVGGRVRDVGGGGGGRYWEECGVFDGGPIVIHHVFLLWKGWW